MANLDLYKKEWLEVVFADKNKVYGAYRLRNDSSANASKALIIGSIAFILLFFLPKIYSLINGSDTVNTEVLNTEVVVLMPPKPLNEKIVAPPPVEPPKSRVEQVKNPPPIVTPDNLAIENPPTVEKLKLADPGQRNIEADPTGGIVINEPIGNGPKREAAAASGDDQDIYSFKSIEVQPVFPGGMDKFYKYLSTSIRYPAMAADNGVNGKVYLQFIVEKNGSLTDIIVQQGPGSGLNEEAIRVLKASPRWVPGNQNGKFVRVRYNIAINFNLN